MARRAKNLALLRSALLAFIPFEPFELLDAAFDHYRDHRGQAWHLVQNARPFLECPRQPIALCLRYAAGSGKSATLRR